jgi:hypothetical protein
MEFFILWVIVLVITTAVGASKGRGGMGFALGFFLGIIGLIIAVVMDGEFKCPHCGNKLTSKSVRMCPICKNAVAL